MIRKMVLVFLFAFFLLPIAGANGYNPAYQMNAVFRPVPDIDGVMTESEWNDASTVTFNNTVVYLKQDGKNLYAAFNISDNTVNVGPSITAPQDWVAIGIDVENNGGWYPQPDDVFLYVFRGGHLAEAQGTTPPSTVTSGWNAVIYSTNDYWQVEYNITYTKTQINAGESKTLGIVFTSGDYAVSFQDFWPPMTQSEAGSPSNWGNLVSEENWVPEFQPLTAALMLVLATILAIRVYRRKHTSTSSRLSSNFSRRISQI